MPEPTALHVAPGHVQVPSVAAAGVVLRGALASPCLGIHNVFDVAANDFTKIRSGTDLAERGVKNDERVRRPGLGLIEGWMCDRGFGPWRGAW